MRVRLLFLAVLALAPLSGAARAQVETREGIYLQNQLLELKRDVQSLRDQLNRNSATGGSVLGANRTPSAPAQNADATTALLERVARLEDDLRQLRGQNDELANNQKRMSEDFAKQIDDLKYKNFQEAKAGDLVIGYVTSPQREVVAVCKISKGIHQTDEGEAIEIEKLEQLTNPIAYEALQANPDLANSEPIINNQGSLFKLTEQEYEIIRSLVDDANIPVKFELEAYDKQKAMKELFLAEPQFDEMLAALNEKKNLVLQGAPGVGKTFVAKRLAYALIESKDPQRVEVIQFHQSYSYEDFIQGFRPTPKGHFDLKHGIFHQFCRRAQRDEGRPYVFIIDEINRGNLSKIFGELMMLIEPDKRGREHAIPLAYSQDADEKFYIPENLYLIGMMNTADRSLAMVDYALRRRFRFITLRPEFSSAAFQAYLANAEAKPELVMKIVARMNALNEAIAADTKNLGPGYQIGHSYFCPRNGTNPDDGWYRRVIESEIAPLVQEYWFDNEQKVKEQRLALLA